MAASASALPPAALTTDDRSTAYEIACRTLGLSNGLTFGLNAM